MPKYVSGCESRVEFDMTSMMGELKKVRLWQEEKECVFVCLLRRIGSRKRNGGGLFIL